MLVNLYLQKKMQAGDDENERGDILRQFGSYFLLFEPVFGKTADRKTLIYYYLLAQTEKTIINYHLKFEHVQTA